MSLDSKTRAPGDLEAILVAMTDQTDRTGELPRISDAGAQEVAPRRRRSSETRLDILRTAHRMFSENSYAEIALKDIAKEAGVSAPLIIKYFGSKEHLFESQLDFSAVAAAFDEVPFAELGIHFTTVAITSPPDSPNSIVHRLAESGGNRNNVDAISRIYREQVVDWLVGRVEQEAPGFSDEERPATMDAEMRVEAAMSMLAGLSLMRRLVTEDFFQSSRVTTFISYYGSLVQGALNGGSEAVT